MNCLPAKKADMADSNAVGINEMFRRLRSAKLLHVADRVPKGFRAPGLRTKINRAPGLPRNLSRATGSALFFFFFYFKIQNQILGGRC